MRVNIRVLRLVLNSFLDQLWPNADIDLSICIVGEPEMTRLNETFVRHQGSTDVITFDYSDPADSRRQDLHSLHGEIFVCADEARLQSRRFRTTWPEELVRYIVHGVLHLSGYDDQRPAQRREMKRAEDRWLRRLSAVFPLAQIGRRASLKTKRRKT